MGSKISIEIAGKTVEVLQRRKTLGRSYAYRMEYIQMKYNEVSWGHILVNEFLARCSPRFDHPVDIFSIQNGDVT